MGLDWLPFLSQFPDANANSCAKIQPFYISFPWRFALYRRETAIGNTFVTQSKRVVTTHPPLQHLQPGLAVSAKHMKSLTAGFYRAFTTRTPPSFAHSVAANFQRNCAIYCFFTTPICDFGPTLSSSFI